MKGEEGQRSSYIQIEKIWRERKLETWRRIAKGNAKRTDLRKDGEGRGEENREKKQRLTRKRRRK